MSGGCFEYSNDRACREIFGWEIDCDYGDKGFSQSPRARRLNPLKNKVMSEMAWDLFCVLHSYDWYSSGDTDEEVYREDVKRFKDKWLKLDKPKIKVLVDDELEEARQSLYLSLGLEDATETQ